MLTRAIASDGISTVQGRSGSHPDFEGSLLIWTHKLKGVAWHGDVVQPAAPAHAHDAAAPLADNAMGSTPAFVPEGCSAAALPAPQQAVTLQAGNQFADFYPLAEARGVLVNGGTCTSVGVGGCTLGGCFGSFSQKLGPSASNVLQAKVVLANGTLVTANSCLNPDLFWALRGGGAGYGVVVEWTMRTYKSPAYLSKASYSGTVGSDDPAHLQAVAVEVLRHVSVAQAARAGYNGGIKIPFPGSPSFGFELQTYEGDASDAHALFAGLEAWVKAAPAAMQLNGATSSTTEHRPSNGTWAKPGQRWSWWSGVCCLSVYTWRAQLLPDTPFSNVILCNAVPPRQYSNI